MVLREAGKDSFEDNPDKGIFEMDLHRLELPTPFPVGPVNAYLLRGDPLTLVDTGPKTVEAQTALGREGAAAGARLKDFRRILLTHGNTDNAGNAAWGARRSGEPCRWRVSAPPPSWSSPPTANASPPCLSICNRCGGC